MTGNGTRRPPRPRIELVSGAPTEAESAAIAAALERHLSETAQVPAGGEVSRWQQAALREGILREPQSTAWGPRT